MEFRAVLIGSDCPMFCEDAHKGIDMDKVNTYPRRTHIHGKHYRCTLQRNARPSEPFVLDFWNSYHTEDKQLKPRVSAYDVLACLTKSDPGTFEEFCSDYGYDSDSRRAEQTYQAVREEWRKVQAFFSAQELAELQEIA